MKNKVLYLLVAVVAAFSPSFTQGQSITAKAFFNTDSISAVYLGIDFTLAKLINDAESNATVIQSQQFNGINDLVVKEYKKYDVQKAYHRINWTVDTKEVEARNLKANPDQLKSTHDGDLTRLSSGDIDKLVSNFDFGSHKGYGVLLIVEGLDKTKKLATIWFTLINMGAKKVLTTERVDGKLGNGFGFRNYWASAIKNAINTVEDKKYKQWKVAN
jgi:Skp family chaperone for outer membrane proteins